MVEVKYSYNKEAILISNGGIYSWSDPFCSKSKNCYIYEAYERSTEPKIIYRCSNFLGVNEIGLKCKILNSIHFILSED